MAVADYRERPAEIQVGGILIGAALIGPSIRPTFVAAEKCRTKGVFPSLIPRGATAAVEAARLLLIARWPRQAVHWPLIAKPIPLGHKVS